MMTLTKKTTNGNALVLELNKPESFLAKVLMKELAPLGLED